MLLFCAVLFLVLAIAFVGYSIYNEKWQYSHSWPLPEYSEMIAIAKEKKDHEMNEKEFNLKYAGFRHEMFRASLFPKSTIRTINNVLHNLEVYLFHGGPRRLEKKVSIKQPIFIIGDFRSGTSVLERLICHHPQMTYFEMSHQLLWAGPYIWNKFLAWMGYVRYNILGHKSWNNPALKKGMYYPHSSNVLLHRGRPFEIEILWESCKRNLVYRRCHNWKILDDPVKNHDLSSNSKDIDCITEELDDPAFEKLFKNTVRLILSMSGNKNARFILKNPLNAYRVRLLHKLFPDAKFIHIARNPIKTTLSQIRMAESNLRCFFMDDKECRINNNKPQKKQGLETWNHVFNNKYPNEFTGTLWWPRIFPRTNPEYKQITKYLKTDQYECAVATAVCQQERVALEAFKKIAAVEGENLLTLWHEDILENAEGVFERAMAFCNLKCTKKERLEWLELEDFPGGQANRKRVKQSNKHERGVDFGKHNDEVYDILKGNDVMRRYENRNNNVNDYQTKK